MDLEKEITRIVSFIQDLIEKSRTEGIIVGLSGGIDSALTAALCLKAVGKEKMMGLILPCYSDPIDIEDAKLVANNLDIKDIVINLDWTYDAFLNAISQDFEPDRMANANLKARLRMCTLYYLANKFNYLVAGTGNKTEDEIGYFTKYGDGGVDFLPIQHLYKHEVREMAKLLEIPVKIIERKPTAGLWKGQTDEDELSKQLGFQIDYDLLDQMVKNIKNNDFDPKDTKYKALLDLMEKNKHKIQLPPSLERKQ
ncbi:MAG: NAD+ synthase [Candidatus Lokiarchaeota archaeon]|nr:NAD+ synthase [Candidatus Lokiarchaeota archaeon]